MIENFLQFHCSSSYRDDLYRIDLVNRETTSFLLDHYSDSVAIGTIETVRRFVHTSGGPIIEYMRKKWKYCCKWRPCSGTSFFNRPSTAVNIWSLSVALLSSSAKQTNNLALLQTVGKFWAKTSNRSNKISRCHIRVFVAWLGNPNYCSRLRLTCDKCASSSSCSHLHQHEQKIHLQAKSKCKL